MMMLAITAALMGFILGLRFKVLILAPAIVISLVAIFGIGIANGNNPRSILLATLFATTALQIGYLAGIVIRFGVARTRARRHPSGIVVVAHRR